jgi:tetratricopeptide (TPR) repeat protein
VFTIALVVIAFPECALAQQDARRAGRANDRLAPSAERAVAASSLDARARFIQGVGLMEQGKADEAFDVFFALTQEYPEFAEPYNNLAVLYAARGDYERARGALEMAILANPEYAIAHENLGDVHARLASQAYAKAAQIDAANRSARAKLALALDLLGANGRRDNPTNKEN